MKSALDALAAAMVRTPAAELFGTGPWTVVEPGGVLGGAHKSRRLVSLHMTIKVCVGRVAWMETLVEDLLGMTAVVAIQRLVVFAPHRLVADAVDVDATVCGCGKAARVARPQVEELADEAAGQGKPVAVRQQTALGLPVVPEVYWRFVSPKLLSAHACPDGRPDSDRAAGSPP